MWSVTHVQGFRLGGRRGLQGSAPWILREGNAYPESLAAVASVSPLRGYGSRRGSFSQYPKGGQSSALPLQLNSPPLTPTVNHQQSFALGLRDFEVNLKAKFIRFEVTSHCTLDVCTVLFSSVRVDSFSTRIFSFDLAESFYRLPFVLFEL